MYKVKETTIMSNITYDSIEYTRAQCVGCARGWAWVPIDSYLPEHTSPLCAACVGRRDRERLATRLLAAARRAYGRRQS